MKRYYRTNENLCACKTCRNRSYPGRTIFQWYEYWKISSRGMCVCLVSQSRLPLYDPMDCGHPGSSISGILQSGILEWVVISSSIGSFWPRDRTHVSCGYCTGRQILYHCYLGSPLSRDILRLTIRCRDYFYKFEQNVILISMETILKINSKFISLQGEVSKCNFRLKKWKTWNYKKLNSLLFLSSVHFI